MIDKLFINKEKNDKNSDAQAKVESNFGRECIPCGVTGIVDAEGTFTGTFINEADEFWPLYGRCKLESYQYFGDCVTDVPGLGLGVKEDGEDLLIAAGKFVNGYLLRGAIYSTKGESMIVRKTFVDGGLEGIKYLENGNWQCGTFSCDHDFLEGTEFDENGEIVRKVIAPSNKK